MNLKADQFVSFFYCLFILLCPFYIFPSGQPQPADIALAVGGLIMFFNIPKSVFFKPPTSYLTLFVILVFIINYFNQLSLNYLQLPGNTFISSLFYLFNLFAFVLGIFVVKRKHTKKMNLIAGVIMLSVALQSICGFMGLGNAGQARYSIFFNNPNQLGYFALCSFTFFSILPSKFRANIYYLTIMILMSSYLVLLSESRASLGGIALLTILIFIKEGLKIKWQNIFALTVIGFVGFFFISQNSFFENQLNKISERNEEKSSTLEDEIMIRGYDRIFIYNDYILYGAGEGGNSRFIKAYHQGEIHSGFGTILFSYGVLGLILFLTFCFSVIKANFFQNLLIIAPILIYNLTHMGFRESLFWMILSFLFITSVFKSRSQ